jgi:hypothetical protein
MLDVFGFNKVEISGQRKKRPRTLIHRSPRVAEATNAIKVKLIAARKVVLSALTKPPGFSVVRLAAGTPV